MPKKFKYLVSSILSALGFYLFVTLPYDTRYYGLLVGVVLIIFCVWFGLGIIFEESVYIRLMAALLPVLLFIGFGMFASLLAGNQLVAIGTSAFFGFLIYILFLVENVFMVAIGYKTVPLYRAAYTSSLIVVLLTSFFVFDTLFSFKFNYLLNTLATFIISIILFEYQFWAVTIEMDDDGKNKDRTAYVIIPAVLTAEIALALSFWPVGIFKGSIYLTSVIYIMSGLLQADLRERLFRKVWLGFVWIGVAVLLGVIAVTTWN